MFYYVGLLIFALNGLQWMALRQERAAARVRDERIVRLLMARKGNK